MALSPCKSVMNRQRREPVEPTEEKITEIGTRCGFQEMNRFARTFHALKSRTPSQYRPEKRTASIPGELGG